MKAWRLTPLDAVETTQPAAPRAKNLKSPLDAIRNRAVRKKAATIWEKIKDHVTLDDDQRVIYPQRQTKGSPVSELLEFLTTNDKTRPLDLHNFIALIRHLVPISMLHRNKRKLFVKIKAVDYPRFFYTRAMYSTVSRRRININ